MRKMGPLLADHPLVRDATICQGCSRPFLASEYVTLVLIGPGVDEDARQRRDEGRAYTAVAIPIHWDCAEH